MGKLRLTALLGIVCLVAFNIPAALAQTATARPYSIVRDQPLAASVPPGPAVMQHMAERADAWGAARQPGIGANRPVDDSMEHDRRPGSHARGNVEFAQDERIPLSPDALSVLPLDYDGDGDTDFAVTTERGFELLTRGPEGYGPPIEVNLAGAPRLLLQADTDGDGRPELLAATTQPHALIAFRWNGATMEEVARHALDVDPGTMVVFDADLDGDSDLAIGNDNHNSVTVFRNDGKDGFVLVGTHAIGSAEGYSPTGCCATTCAPAWVIAMPLPVRSSASRASAPSRTGTRIST